MIQGIQLPDRWNRASVAVVGMLWNVNGRLSCLTLSVMTFEKMVILEMVMTGLGMAL